MNTLAIPPSTNWYEPQIMACAPDNTVVYGARNDLVVICPSENDAPSEIKVITRAHSQKVVSVSVNKNWGSPHKYAVSVAEDKIVKLWNMETLKKKMSHNEHTAHGNVVGANFGGDDRVISATEKGIILVWNIVLNSFQKIEILGPKDNITCLSTCPHAGWITAFGLKNGLVAVCDLRKEGKLLYKLRGHDKSVLSLAWCPVPINIFPQSPRNIVGVKKPEGETGEIQAICEEIQNIDIRKDVKMDVESPIEVKTEEKKVYKPKKNLWTNLKHADDDEVPPDFADRGRELPVRSGDLEEDFLTECLKLKSKILEATQDVDSNDDVQGKESSGVDTPETEVQKTKEEVKAVQESSEVIKLVSETLDAVKQDIKEEKQTVTENSNVEAVSETTTEINDKKSESASKESPTSTTIIVPEIEEPRKEYLLASSGKESNIYIWRAGTDGRMQTFLTVPGKNIYKKGKPSMDKTWITICWPTPGGLLSSSKHGEVLQWILPKPKDKERQYKLVHKDHNNLIFNIVSPLKLFDKFNWNDEVDQNVWSCGQDRLILNTSLKPDRRNLACYPTLGGWITCLASSPVDANRLAISSGEGVIKIWDLSRPHTKNIYMSHFYNKILSRVTALVWHPTKEHLLAFATLEGRIGLIDSSNHSKAPIIFKQFFKSLIHTLEFGPIDEDNHHMGLYAVAEGKLVIFDIKTPEDEPTIVDTPENIFVYMASWKPDYSKLIVSTKSKSLIIYNPDLTIDCTLYVQHKFEKIVWHPDAIHSDEDKYKYCNVFAGTNASKEFVLCSIKKFEDPKDNILDTFTGHLHDVNALAWNPFDNKHLVSASEDGTAHIWDIETNSILATFIHNNFEPILSVIWSPVDSDFVIIGAKDYLIRVWKVSDNPPIEDLAELRKKTIKDIQNETTDLLPKTLKDIEDTPKPSNKSKSCKIDVLPAFYTPRNIQNHVKDLKSLLAWKEGTLKDCDLLITKIFGGKSDMIEILNRSHCLNKHKGKYSNTNVIELMKGDVKEGIETAIKEKRVTRAILSIAPMVSTDMWQKACDVYAQQLLGESESDPIEIMTYLLALHRVEEAVNVLCDYGLHKEALALAKSRFPENSKIIDDVIEKWAKASMLNGNFEVAAQCYIFLGQYAEAATVLFRRSDIATLELACNLAEKSKNEDLHKAVLARYNAFKAENISCQKINIKIETIPTENKTEDGQDFVIIEAESSQDKDAIVQVDGKVEEIEAA